MIPRMNAFGSLSDTCPEKHKEHKKAHKTTGIPPEMEGAGCFLFAYGNDNNLKINILRLPECKSS